MEGPVKLYAAVVELLRDKAANSNMPNDVQRFREMADGVKAEFDELSGAESKFEQELVERREKHELAQRLQAEVDAKAKPDAAKVAKPAEAEVKK